MSARVQVISETAFKGKLGFADPLEGGGGYLVLLDGESHSIWFGQSELSFLDPSDQPAPSNPEKEAHGS